MYVYRYIHALVVMVLKISAIGATAAAIGATAAVVCSLMVEAVLVAVDFSPADGEVRLDSGR